MSLQAPRYRYVEENKQRNGLPRFCREPTTGIEHRMANLNLPFFHNTANVVPRESYKHVDVSKWKVTFSGSESVTNFLERVEKLRSSRGVSKEQLLRSVPELLTH